jgi:hypothetical protein
MRERPVNRHRRSNLQKCLYAANLSGKRTVSGHNSEKQFKLGTEGAIPRVIAAKKNLSGKETEEGDSCFCRLPFLLAKLRIRRVNCGEIVE